ncbi:MAG: hypothetical protein L0Z62_06895 [Gemmataceae bacterium]|nr:hypothetical protein [Gemmataceae bacterium]
MKVASSPNPDRWRKCLFKLIEKSRKNWTWILGKMEKKVGRGEGGAFMTVRRGYRGKLGEMSRIGKRNVPRFCRDATGLARRG